MKKLILAVLVLFVPLVAHASAWSPPNLVTTKPSTGIPGELRVANGRIVQGVSVGTADATTLNVSTGNLFLLPANTGATAIGGLTGGVPGQVIDICGTSDTNSSTIADSAPFYLTGAFTAAADACIRLLIESGAHFTELSRGPITAAVTGAISLDNGGEIGNAVNNSVTVSENSETLSFDFTSNAVGLTSSTGIATFDFGTITPKWDTATAEGVITMKQGGTFDNDTNNAFKWTENSEDWVWTFAANKLTVSSSTGVNQVVYSGIGIDAPYVATSLVSVRFCGNGPNAATATYLGPVLESSYGTDMSPGSAGCAALDSTTEATADAPIDAFYAYKPVAMVCATTCGTNDTMTVQLRSATADVAGATCNITLTGSAAECTYRTPTPATITAGATVAVKVVNSTDDNCSAGFVDCTVTFAR